MVKDMVSRPQTTMVVAELLSTSVPELVLRLQRYALPWLVLTKRKEVVQKIAEFRAEKEAWQPCVDNANLGSILALLLAQDVVPAEIESFTMTLLRHISSHFNGLSLVDLVRAEMLQTTLELLKAAGDADSRRSRVRKPARDPHPQRG